MIKGGHLGLLVLPSEILNMCGISLLIPKWGKFAKYFNRM